MSIQQSIPLQTLLVLFTSAELYYDTEEIAQDWEEDNWRQDRQLIFPREECLGEKMVLRAGESAVIKSHKSFGLSAYDDGFRCRWVFRPLQCDLGLVCHLQTRTARSGSRSCEGGDYVRIMKGQQGVDGVTFHKKYCGKRTASLKFSGNETLKIVFKASSNARKPPSKLDGFTCRVVCLSNNKPTSKPTLPPSTSTSTTTPPTTVTTSTESSSTSRCSCGEPYSDGKIICPPGQSCDSGPVPWQVGITYLGSPRPECGGSLINSQYVLSAAHCFQNTRRWNKLRVRLGDLDWTTKGESERKPELELAVEKVIIHPRYQEKTQFDFDFAILKLERPIDFDAYYWLRPVCLPVSEPVAEETGRVTGWGWTKPDISSQSSLLQSLEVTVMSRSACLSHYSPSQLTENMVCATTPGGDSCRGDSGGPLTVLRRGRHELAGLVSWGISCAKARWPGVYSKVAVARDWIVHNSRQADWCTDRPVLARTENRGDRRA